ncbi:MAG: acyltransferase [Winogradskyella sp.]|uniref:acyltransferase n=1 Tax=Winogradskyella sp. TaxID=1883156 RepID=UPI00385F63E7
MSFIKTLKQKIGFEYYRWNEKTYEKFLRKRGVKIGKNTFWGNVRTINIDTTRPSLVEIGDNVRIDTGMTILTHDYPTWVFRKVYNDFVSSSGQVKIGNNVYCAQYVTVLKGVTIGDNCIIGFGSVVTKDIPSNSVAVGQPAKVVSTLDEYYEKCKDRALEDTFVYANSIRERFKREPVPEDFWEEFQFFMDGNETNNKLPIKRQLGSAFETYKQSHISKYKDFNEFIEASKNYKS